MHWCTNLLVMHTVRDLEQHFKEMHTISKQLSVRNLGKINKSGGRGRTEMTKFKQKYNNTL